MDTVLFHRIIQYCLYSAAKSDEYGSRFLGPIHLLKYAYLVDLDFARHNDGRTFTGIDWVFHHFGPWSAPAFLEIETAVSNINAERNSVRSKFGDKDCLRWQLKEADGSQYESSSNLPLEVRHTISAFVRRFGNDTSALLHFVYATPPMLSAAPGEKLDFGAIPPPMPQSPVLLKPYLEQLPKEERAARREAMNKLRNQFQARATSSPLTSPLLYVSRMDRVYEEGVRWLDSLGGSTFPEGETKVVFSEEIWKSAARNGNV